MKSRRISSSIGKISIAALPLLWLWIGAAPAEAQVTEFSIPLGSPAAVPGPRPQCIARGSDGNLWYANRNGSRIGKITPAGSISEYAAVGNLGSLPLRPQCLALGADGNMWATLTETTQGQIAKITPAGNVTVYQTLVPSSRLYSIAPGEDGAMWFTESGFNVAQIGRIASDGTITHFPIATPANDRFGIESSITPGPDHALWFTEIDANKIGRITTAGSVTEFPIPTAASTPMGIATGPDGALWFVEFDGNKIGRVTTSGAFTEYLIPTAGARPRDIAAGPDGALWFTESATNSIGRITTAGVVSEIAVPTSGSGPEGIASGPGGIWFTEFSAGKIGFIAAGPGTACVPSATHLCLNSGRFQATVTWRVPPQGTSGVGTAVPLTGDTGYYWFFSPNNVELVLKVVDGRAFNNRFWVFYGALTDVEYTIDVLDTATGATQSYFNAYTHLTSASDTAAFPGPVASPMDRRASPSAPVRVSESVDATARLAACTPDPNNLCLNAGRFRVHVDWNVPAPPQSGQGMATSITGDTGHYWFFSSNNIELIVKVVDGTAFNGKFWVFSGALTNVAYTITVTDTQTGAVKTYTNPFGTQQSIADTAAF